MPSEQPLLAYFGHHKCASTWIHRIVNEIAWGAGLEVSYLHRPSQFDGNLRRFARRGQFDFVSYVNAQIEYVKPLSNFRAFHVVRDPRDLIVSAYFSHLHSHSTLEWPELERHRVHLQSVAKSEGLLLELGFSGSVLDDMRRWDYGQPNVLELRMEDLTRSPYDGYLRIFEFLGLLDATDVHSKRRLKYSLRSSWNSFRHWKGFAWLPRSKTRTIPGELVLGAVYEHRFSKLSGGRRHGAEDVQSHYRKGVHGDWINHFDAHLAQQFQDRYGDLVAALGYESDAEWGLADRSSLAIP